MKPTGKPVYRPTADSIWNSFLNSNKHHLILTGGRGTGKTCRIERLRGDMPGLITRAVPETGVYIEKYPSGEKARIGVYDPFLPGETNKMRPCPEELEYAAVSMIGKLTECGDAWAFIDEIGYLESGSLPYMNALRRLFDNKRVIAAVRKQDIPFLNEIRGRRDVFCVDLDAPFGNAGCVIMASGLSKRFGGNKLMADFHGEPMIARILSVTEGIFARRVVVTRHSEIAALSREQGIEAILHDLPFRSDTVRLGIEAVGDVNGCMFCPADQPLLRQETVEGLVLCAGDAPQSIWRPVFGENHGSPVLFPRWTFDELKCLPEGKGGGYIAKMYPEKVRTLPVRTPYELMDADDRVTFELLENILRES